MRLPRQGHSACASFVARARLRFATPTPGFEPGNLSETDVFDDKNLRNPEDFSPLKSAGVPDCPTSAIRNVGGETFTQFTNSLRNRGLEALASTLTFDATFRKRRFELATSTVHCPCMQSSPCGSLLKHL